MTPSVVSVQRLAFFSLRIPDSELGCDVGSARDPIKRGGSLAYVPSFSLRAQCTIEMKFGSRKAGAGQAMAQIGDGPDSPGRLTEKRSLVGPRLAECAFP